MFDKIISIPIENNLEVELRRKIDPSKYLDFISEFESEEIPSKFSESIVNYYSNNRREINEDNKITQEEKKELSSDYFGDFKLSISTENPIRIKNNEEILFTRQRSRTIFYLKDYTIFLTNINDEIYEFEAEFSSRKITEIKQLANEIMNKYFDNYYNNVTYIQKYISYKDLSQARSFKKSDFDNITDYYVTVKIDGIRRLLIFYNNNIYLYYPQPFYFEKISDIIDKKINEDISEKISDIIDKKISEKITIFEGEYLNNIFYFSDCLIYEEESMTNKSFKERMDKFRKYMISANNLETFIKDFEDLSQNYFFEIEFILNKRNDYKEDGLIFIHKKDYQNVLKWKEDITIDTNIFIRNKKYYLSSEGKEFVTDFEYEIEDPDKLIDLNSVKIYELLINRIDNEDKIRMTVIRIRKDKSYPNSQRNLRGIINSFLDPILKDDLLGQSMLLSNRVQNKIKRFLYESQEDVYYQGENLLDIGSGRGGDIKKWNSIIKDNGKLYLIEPNKENRKQLEIRLKESELDENRFEIIPKGGEDLSLFKKIKNKNINYCSLMLSLSFFFTENRLDNLVTNIKNILSKNSKIIFLTIDGEEVQKRFEKYGSEFDLGPTKFRLVENKVIVSIPGIVGENQEEYLVDLNLLEKKLNPEFILENKIKPVLEFNHNIPLNEWMIDYLGMFKYGIFINKNYYLKILYENNNLIRREYLAIKIVRKYSEFNDFIKKNKTECVKIKNYSLASFNVFLELLKLGYNSKNFQIKDDSETKLNNELLSLLEQICNFSKIGQRSDNGEYIYLDN